MFDEPATKVTNESSCDAAFLRYYKGLKASIQDVESTPDETLLIPSYLPDDKKELLEEIVKIDVKVTEYKRRGWQYFAEFGYALAKLKHMYFKTCFLCKSQNLDMFSVLSCKRCVKASNGNTFFTDVKKRVDHENAHINFLITVAGLTTKFPKLVHTPYNSGELKKYMTYLPDQLTKDKHIWI
jgi:hypothetical protein